MCDKKNNVLFTETECLVLSPDFKLLDESQVLLRVPRQSNMYSFDLKNVVPSGDLTCLFAKATIDESKLWHRRLGHVNFKTMNKLVKGNLVRGLPSKIFDNDHTCVACQKGKQHKASLTDDFSRFSWVFFLASKDEPSGILKRFITEIENQLNHKVKVIRILNEAARTMLADSLLPTVFWAEVVNTTCYVLNRVLVTKPHNKTPNELIIGRPPSISFMRPFGCPVTILNTLDPLGKFDGKAEEGFLVGYSINNKAFRVFNSQTRKVKENLHVNFLENKPNVAGQGPNWLFDIDSLTNSMNYQPVTAENQTNKNAGPQEANGDTDLKKSVDARQSEEKNDKTYKNDTSDDAAGETPVQKPVSENKQALKNVLDEMLDQEKEATNPAYHSKTKHLEIRHHFIKDSYEKRLIEMVKIHNDNNVADLLTKDFDGRLMVFKCSEVYTSAIRIEVGMDYNYVLVMNRGMLLHRGDDNVERAITTAASLDATQDSDNIIRTQTTAMPNVDIPQEGNTSGSGEGRMEHQFELTANIPITPHNSPLTGGYIPRSDEAVEILRLKKRFKRLERQRKSSTSQPRRKKYRQVESSDNDLNEEDASKQGRNLEAEEESTMAFELIKFIKSMLEE
ncbi:putative ribonuclease H-like domain-containing protein [Tanacetum coccineum]